MRPPAGSKRIGPAVSGLIVCCVFSGCAVGPNYRAPHMPMPPAFVSAPSASAQPANNPAIDAAAWWKSLGDAELSSLVDRAIKANPQLEIALTRVQEARQQEAVFLGEALPEVEASGGAARGTGSDLARGRADQSLISAENTNGGVHQVTQVYGFAAGWEIDLFGQYRREMEAARYDEQAARAARNNVLIAIEAAVVRSYVDMRGLQMQVAVLKQNVEVAHKYLDFVTSRNQLGITNGLDVTLAQRQLSSLLAEVAPLQSQIDTAQ
jgi:outer membrane protein TolC